MYYDLTCLILLKMNDQYNEIKINCNRFENELKQIIDKLAEYICDNYPVCLYSDYLRLTSAFENDFWEIADEILSVSQIRLIRLYTEMCGLINCKQLMGGKYEAERGIIISVSETCMNKTGSTNYVEKKR